MYMYVFHKNVMSIKINMQGTEYAHIIILLFSHVNKKNS